MLRISGVSERSGGVVGTLRVVGLRVVDRRVVGEIFVVSLLID